ncbi:MAG: cyclic nucleotide-binding protein [Phenylobacterium zucineum]|nr:MAG: cyclic nucleotide-binding protein [Phenylobacterium zucineum]
MSDTVVAGINLEDVLPEALAEAFCALATRIHARRGQMLIAQASNADDVYLILSGRVKFSVFSANGRETILREMGPGCLFGELAAINGQSRSVSVIVVEDADLALTTAVKFRGFLNDVPGAGYWMATQLAARVRDLTEKSSELASLPMAARLVSELLRLTAPQTAEGDTADITRLPTHADLAARIGTHREAVTRELRRLAQDGFVSQSGRRLTVRSRSALKALLARLSR